MIKKILWILIFVFVFWLSFSSAEDLSKNMYVRENNNYWFSPYDNNFDIQVIKYWNLLTNQIWKTLRWIYLRDWTYLVRRYSDYLWWIAPYISYNYTRKYDSITYQAYPKWFPTYYALCDNFDWNNHIADYNLTWCSVFSLNSSSLQLIANFMSWVSSSDSFWFNYFTWVDQNNQANNDWWVLFCFGSDYYNRSICFWISKYQNRNNIIYPWLNSSITNYTWYNQASLPTSFNDLIRSDISMSPWNWNNQSWNNNINNNTTNIGSCPTIWQLMKNMWRNYNTWLCYNNTTYFNGTTFEQIEKQDIFTIFNDNYQEYTNRISIYRNNCTNANTTQACQNAFSGEYKKYSIISNAINSNVDEKKLRNYCNYWLNYDPNTTTCVASWWWIKEEYTNEEIITDLVNNWIIVTPWTNETWSNNVLNAIKCEDWDRKCYVNNRNFIDSLWNIYGKITWLFKERNGVNWIIPNYILRITFLTILFTVIFKK